MVLAVALAAAVPAPPAVAATGSTCATPPVTTDPAIPWPQVQLAPQRVWDLTEGAGITVGVVDSGVDASPPQLAGRVLAGIDVVNAGGGPANTDCYGHGTFVAGIIAAAPAAGAGFAGVAPQAVILPVRAANDANSGSAAALATGIRAAVDGGARVINVSASTDVPAPLLTDAVQYAEAHDVVVVAAAANGAQQGDPVTYPASYPTALAVGAIDSTGALANFSETGNYLDLVAPGENVVSIGPGGGGQWQGSGTSYAAPFVAGIAALVRAYHPKLSAAQVRHRLEATADHPNTTVPDPGFGWGTVDPLAAVTAVLPEEGAAGLAVVHPPSVPKPVVPVPDQLAGEITVLSVLGLVGIGCLAWLCAALWRGRGRRSWRRRVVVVTRSSQH
jgi:type VII secretion-associated serine protease mycosin